MAFRAEPVSGGHEIYDGPFKVAVVTNSSWDGRRRASIKKKGEPNETAHVAIHDALPRESWKLHFTKPDWTVPDLQAVLDVIAALADPPSADELEKSVTLGALEAFNK